MAKKLFFRHWLVLALLLVPTLMSAQEVIEEADSVSEDGVTVTQYDLKECEWVDICDNPKYAIVAKDGRKGIYDMERHQNVTEIEFRNIYYSRTDENEDSTLIDWFVVKKGIKKGILCVFEENNDIMSIWMDDPDEVYSLDECTTIDKKMTKRAKKLLENLMRQHQMDQAQIVVLDAKSGLLRTWVRLDRDMEKEEAGKLLVHTCAGSLAKPFHTVMALGRENLTIDSICEGKTYRHTIKSVDDKVLHQAIMNGYRRSVAERKWREMNDTNNPSTSPFIMAVGYNSLAHQGTMFIPTMKADSVTVDENVFLEKDLASLRDVLRVDRVESPQLAWLSSETEWLGYATTDYLYAEKDKQQEEPIGKQIQFAGLFPVDNPRYTICVVAEKQALDISPEIFQSVVNPLMKWLLKRQ